MNEVEKYLQETGKWHTSVDTDWLGRAVKGSWWTNYYAEWLNSFSAVRKDQGVNPGGWAMDDKYRDWWFSDTPEWDRAWFRAQGVRPPKRWTAKDRLKWVDEGGGLSRMGRS